MPNRLKTALLSALAGLSLCLTFAGRAADTFNWDAKQKSISAEIQSWPLETLLERISANTGWKVYVEPGATHNASAKFHNLPIGDALRSLLGKLNFALVPQTNAPPVLYVFHTSIQSATQLVATKAKPQPKGAKPIPNELIITLRPGANIDVIARAVGAKVIGRVDGLNTYRLQFDSAEAAEAALAYLNSNPDVASVDYNYSIGDIPPLQQLIASSMGDLPLKAKAIGEGGTVTVGLIDTGGQFDNYCGLDGFLLPTIEVAGKSTPQGSSPNHGPAMAETVLRGVSAVNKGGSSAVRILPVDVYGPNPTTSTYDVAVGIYRAVNAGANPINLSLGTTGDSTFLREVISEAHDQGVLIFAAAGNEPVTTPTYPAAYPEVIAVTAGTKQGDIADYANRGSFVDVVAPGGNVVCFNGESWLVQGTSAATAFTSGLASGLKETSGKTAAEIEAAIRSQLAVKNQSH